MPRILLAEDDPEMMAVVTEFLLHDGYEVEPVHDGGRLIVELAQRGLSNRAVVDAVVSDLRMPVSSGLDILESLRCAHWQVPFVLMTAFPDDDTRVQVERLGGILLEKPFAMNDLRSALSTLFDRSP